MGPPSCKIVCKPHEYYSYIYYIHLYPIVTGAMVTNLAWLVVSTPLKNMKVSWDHYSQYMESHKSHVPVTTNQ